MQIRRRRAEDDGSECWANGNTSYSLPTTTTTNTSISPEVSNNKNSTYDFNDNDHHRRKKQQLSPFIFFKGGGPFLLRLYCIIIIIISIIFLLYYYALTNYSWVHRRCFYSNFVVPWSVRSSIECYEAYYHKQAELEPTLWSPLLTDDDNLLTSLYNKRNNNDNNDNNKEFLKQPPSSSNSSSHQWSSSSSSSTQQLPVKHIHYTLTAPWNPRAWDLALCSIRMASFYLCSSDDNDTDDVMKGTSDSSCTVNIWIVDKAATNQTLIDSLLKDLKMALSFPSSPTTTQSSFVKSCIRIVPEGEFKIQEIHPFASDGRTNSTTTTTTNNYCTPLNGKAIKLRKWLANGANNQLPEHISDAWRLVALQEIGGLYLDADILPLSRENLLYGGMPGPATIPTQMKEGIGAYRLNGGILRIEPESIFLRQMIQDHLYWAQKLETLPTNNQTFGFLGPAALTRTYLNLLSSNQIMIAPSSSSLMTKKDGNEDGNNDNNKNNNNDMRFVTILPPKLVVNQFKCVDTKHAWAVHFTAKAKKKTWKARVKGSCFEPIVAKYCPEYYHHSGQPHHNHQHHR